MKRIICLVLVIVFAGVMLLPVAAHVNQFPGNRVQMADNNGPMPPWPPPRSAGSPIDGGTTIADNNGPMPPWPPPRSGAVHSSSLAV